jgi:hypothetical protein
VLDHTTKIGEEYVISKELADAIGSLWEGLQFEVQGLNTSLQIQAFRKHIRRAVGYVAI